MIKAMDIVHTAEKIMGNSGKNYDPTQPDFLVPGSFVSVDLPGAEGEVYKVLELSGDNFLKVQNLETKKFYKVPTELVSTVLIDDPFDDDSIKNFQLKKDPDKPSSDNKIDQVGVKAPDPDAKLPKRPKKPKNNGEFILHGQPQYAQSRYVKSGQFTSGDMNLPKLI